MAKRVSLSGDRPELRGIGQHYSDLRSSLELYFSADSPLRMQRFAGYTEREVAEELRERLEEVDLTSSLTVLGAIEAAFRIDYFMRYDRRKKDDVSRALRELYKMKQERASLEQEIFQAWIDNSSGSGRIFGELRGAFKFRHWLAHGRYWNPKLGRRYTFTDVFTLAVQVLQSFPLYGIDQN